MTDRSSSSSLSITEPGSDRVSDGQPIANGGGDPNAPPSWFRGKSNRPRSDSGGSTQSEPPPLPPPPPPTRIPKRRSQPNAQPTRSAKRDVPQDFAMDDSALQDDILQPQAWYIARWKDFTNLLLGRVKFARLGLLVSFSLHFMILALLGLWIITREKEQPVEIAAELTEQTQPVEFEDIDMEFNALPDFKPEGQDVIDDRPQVTTENFSVAADMKAILDGGDGPKGDIGGGIALPPQALKKGSFAVWTEPRDPIPKEPYYIIIDVDISTLDKEFKKYPARDISGSVVGTDNYEQDFGGRRERGNLPIVDDHVRMKVLVPGAARLVQDTIEVESKLLKEKQKITIVF